MLGELCGAEGHELPIRSVRHRLGEPDRSNLRRVVRGLRRRDLVYEPDGLPPSLDLTMWGVFVMSPMPEHSDPLADYRQKWARIQAEIAEARIKENRRREAKIARYPAWIRYDSIAERETIPGPLQNRVLAVLYKYADPPDAGLPVVAVKAIMGGERSNVRRAIRTLLARARLDETPDGERIRLSEPTLEHYAEVMPALSLTMERFDKELVEDVLAAYGEDVRALRSVDEVVAQEAVSGDY